MSSSSCQSRPDQFYTVASPTGDLLVSYVTPCSGSVWRGVGGVGGGGVGGGGGKKVTSFDRFIMKSRGPGLTEF